MLFQQLLDDSHRTPPHVFFFISSKDKSLRNYLSSKFFFRNFFVAAAVDDDDEPAVEHVSVVNGSRLILLFSIEGKINDGELGWTNFGTIGNNLISFGLGVLTLIEFVENDVNSDEWDLFLADFCCFEHQ